MGGIRNQHDFPRLSFAPRLDCGLDRHHAAELAMRARLRRHRDGVHARHRQQGVGERLNDFERSLRRRDRLQWVDVGEARQARHFLVETRIVLHRAGAQGIKPGVDRVVVARQAHVMADRLRFGEAGQFGRALARVRSKFRLEWRRLVDVDAGRIEAPGLEDERLLHVEPAIACKGLALRGGGRFGTGRAALNVHGNALSRGLLQAIGKRARISRAVVFAIRLGARDDDAIVEPGLRQEPRHGQTANDASRGQRLNQLLRRPWGADHELVEEMRIDHFNR